MKNFFVAGLLCLSSFSWAHERFMLPSHTLLSGDAPQTVTVLASISNDIFHPDRPLGDNFESDSVGDLKPLFDVLRSQHITSIGEPTAGPRWRAFTRYSVADWSLKSSGTHRLTLMQPEVRFTTFTSPDGSYGRRFGVNPKLPIGVTNIVKRASTSRVETFASLNDITFAAVKPQAQGLALSGSSHPNDLFVGEAAQFQLFYDGEPIASEVKIVRGGTRHRNARQEIKVETNTHGSFEFTPEHAGFYLIIANHAVEQPQEADIDVKHYGLMLTLEVFPQ